MSEEKWLPNGVRYICADLALSSQEDLTPLAKELEDLGVCYCSASFYEGWRLTAGPRGCGTPETEILHYLDVFEKLSPEGRRLFDTCDHREFDLGFQSGLQPFSIRKSISSGTMERAARLGFSIEITLYQLSSDERPASFFEWTAPDELTDDRYRRYVRSRMNGGNEGIRDSDLGRVRQLRKRVRRPGLRILELGAGSGQTTAALAKAGHRVTSVEIDPRRAAEARDLLASERLSAQVLEGDIMTADLGRGYDAVFWWTGFGSASDRETHGLLRKAAEEWLQDGKARLLINVCSPLWYAKQSPGPRTTYGALGTTHTFYHEHSSRLGEKWWFPNPNSCVLPDAKPEASRSLRCYSEADFELLVRTTGLRIHAIDYPDDDHSFLAILVKR